MRIEFYKTYNQIHTWTGILSGLLLYICFVGGTLTMLKMPLNQWALQTEAALPTVAYEDYDLLIQKVLANHPESHAEMKVNLPPALPQSAPVSWVVEDHDTHTTTLWHASLNDNNELLVEQASVSAIGEFFDHLHRTAGIPGGDGHDAIGTFVMGLVAALYFLAIVSGLIIFLPTWFKDFLSLRKGDNRKRFWLDTHNILGVTALPFHIIIALTTVVFAYHDIFYDSLRNMVYKETPMFERPTPRPPGQDLTQLATINQLESAIQTLEPEFQLAEVKYSALNTPRALVMVGGNLEGQWVRGANFTYAVSDPFTGEPGFTAMLPNQPGITAKVVNGFFALHYGGYGGNMVRWLYVGLGITGALLFLTGNILWIETRRKRQKKNAEAPQQTLSSRILARLTVGVCLGVLLGIALSLLCVKWLPHQNFNIQFWQQAMYYTGFLGGILWAFLQSPLHAAKHMLLAVIVLTILLIGSTFFKANSYTPLAVNIGFALFSAILAIAFIATLKTLRKREAVISTDSAWL